MAEYKVVMICGEFADGALASITTELLGIGRKLANELGEELSAALIGSGVGNSAKDAIAFGADKVYVVDNPLLKNYQVDAYVAVMAKLCQQVKPDILLLGQSSMGRDLAPRLAFRLGVGLAMDCIDLAIDPGTKFLLQTRPVYGGNALAIYSTKTKPQMATVRLKCMSPLERDDSRKGEVVSLDAGIDASIIRAKFVEKVREEVAGVRLEDAEVVVCGGRGVGGAEGFKILEELARLLGGAVGASRPPCDAGWAPSSLLVGLTGKIVTPQLYIAVGVSGASQHMQGCSGAKKIVAINKDPEANIFKVGHYGVVGDYKKVLPPFIKKCKGLLDS